jgi:hypothetical protein
MVGADPSITACSMYYTTLTEFTTPIEQIQAYKIVA